MGARLLHRRGGILDRDRALGIRRERGVRFPIQIFGTDLSDSGDRQGAAQDFYGDELGLSPERLRRYFVKTPNGYRINKTDPGPVRVRPARLLGIRRSRSWTW